MNVLQKRKSILKNQEGFLLLDFLYSAIIILTAFTFLGAICISLTLTSVVQYVSFAGARAYFAGDMNEGFQAEAADKKVQALMKSLPFLTGAQKNDWIKIKPLGADNYKGVYPISQSRNQLVGYQLEIELPIMKLNLPIVGRAIDDDIKFKVSSFLLREPSFQECNSYIRETYKTIKTKMGYSTPNGAAGDGGYIAIMDNGC